MKISPVLKICFVLSMSLMLAGCQAESVQPAATTQEVQNIPQTPYTRGPNTPPGVNGPNRPLPGRINSTDDGPLPPESAVQPQTMTEKEDQT